jgi:hypothetical protein
MAKVGRPLIIETPEEMADRVDAYMSECEEAERPPTLSGLALFLGFADRQSLFDYEGRDEFSCAIKKARAFISRHHEERLSGNNPTGSIFWLKNAGWRDSREVDVTTGGDKLPGSIAVTLIRPDDEDGDG